MRLTARLAKAAWMSARACRRCPRRAGRCRAGRRGPGTPDGARVVGLRIKSGGRLVSACSLAGRRRGRPLRPRTGAIASKVGIGTGLSCWLAAVSAKASGGPRASTRPPANRATAIGRSCPTRGPSRRAASPRAGRPHHEQDAGQGRQVSPVLSSSFCDDWLGMVMFGNAVRARVGQRTAARRPAPPRGTKLRSWRPGARGLAAGWPAE